MKDYYIWINISIFYFLLIAMTLILATVKKNFLKLQQIIFFPITIIFCYIQQSGYLHSCHQVILLYIICVYITPHLVYQCLGLLIHQPLILYHPVACLSVLPKLLHFHLKPSATMSRMELCTICRIYKT